MDMAVVAAEKRQQTDSGPSAPKSLGSLVQINSIAIDISGAMEEIESPLHEHFSIRGYVAGMRKMNARTCFPFTSEGGDNSGLCNLPPLFVPTFRWWLCSNCVPDVSSDIRKEALVIDENKDPVRENVEQHRDEDNDLIRSITNSNPFCIRGNEATTSKKVKKDVMDKRGGNECPHMQDSNLLQIRERPDAPDVSCTVHPPCTVGVIDNVSSGSDNASGALPCKRKPKLRFLADIMVEEKKSNSDNPKTRSASPSGVQVTSSETEPFVSPQLDFDDNDKASRNLPRKRKNASEEDSGLLRTVAKKSKGSVLDADRTSRRLDISDRESEEDDSAKADLPTAAKSQLIKPRKTKALEISKKSRQAQTEDGTVLSRDLHKTIASFSESLEENITSSQTNMTKIRHGPKSVEEMEQFSRSPLSGKQTDKFSMLPSSERSTVEADRDDLTLASKYMSEDCNAKGKVALDLSLNSFMDVESNSNDQSSTGPRRFIPDLNEAFPFKSAVTQGMPNLLVKRDSPLHKTPDGYVSYCTDEPMDTERHLGVSNPQNNVDDKKIGSVSDDIPMEIVELLAKNQHERALGNSGKHLMAEGIIGSTTRGCPPNPLYTDGSRSPMDLPFAANRRNVVNVPNGILGIPVNFSQIGKCSADGTKPKENQFGIFNSITPSEQRKVQYSGSSNPIITGSRISTRSELYWPPQRENEPFSVGRNQNRSFVQTNNISMPVFSGKNGTGKAINDVEEIDGKTSLHNGNKKGRIGSSSKSSAGSLDPYSNDTIPALQLLSLMDQGIPSGSSFKTGPENLIEKPLSLCNHHPRVNGKENHKFITKSLFSQNQLKGFPKLGGGVFFPGESSKKASSCSQGQVPFHLEGSSNVVIQTAKTNPPLGVCALNRNPAEFSVPDARNKYTITARDLRPRKRNPRKEKPRTVAEDGRKRQRAKKDLSSGKSKTAPAIK